MQIVSQSAILSYSLFPAVPLLTAPPPRKQLCAPRIAGLLPARVAPHIEIVMNKPPSREELLQQLRQFGPIRSREEMDAEIAELVLDLQQFIDEGRALRAARGRRV